MISDQHPGKALHGPSLSPGRLPPSKNIHLAFPARKQKQRVPVSKGKAALLRGTFVFVGIQGFGIKAAELLKLIQFSFIYFVSSYLEKIYLGRHRSTQPFTNQSFLWNPRDVIQARQRHSASSEPSPLEGTWNALFDLCSHLITVSKV